MIKAYTQLRCWCKKVLVWGEDNVGVFGGMQYNSFVASLVGHLIDKAWRHSSISMEEISSPGKSSCRDSFSLQWNCSRRSNIIWLCSPIGAMMVMLNSFRESRGNASWYGWSRYEVLQCIGLGDHIEPMSEQPMVELLGGKYEHEIVALVEWCATSASVIHKGLDPLHFML